MSNIVRARSRRPVRIHSGPDRRTVANRIQVVDIAAEASTRYEAEQMEAMTLQEEVRNKLGLAPNERILRKAIARLFRPARGGWKVATYGDGWLYLTTERIMWRRGRLTIPFVAPRAVEIPLKELRGCEARGDALTTLLLGRGGGLVLTTDEQEHRFLVAKQRLWPPAFWFSTETTEEWCEAINSARAP